MEGNSCISLVDNEILRNEKIESLLRENRFLKKKSQMPAKESIVSNRGLCWTTGNEAEVVREFLDLPKPSCFSRVQLLWRSVIGFLHQRYMRSEFHPGGKYDFENKIIGPYSKMRSTITFRFLSETRMDEKSTVIIRN